MLHTNLKQLISASRRTPAAAGLLCLVVTSVGWGLNWPAMKVLLTEWPPLFARGSAGLAAALIIAFAAKAAGQSLRVPRGEAGRLVFAALINVFAWMGFATLALRWLKAGQAALLVYTMPVWVLLLAWPVLRKRPTVNGIIGLGLCFIGLILLFGGQEMPVGVAQVPGIMFALGAAILFAFGTVALKPPALPPLSSVAWQLFIGCAPMVVYGCVVEQPDVLLLSARGWAIMAYMTAVPMGLCYITWFAAVRRLPPEVASMSTLLTPVVGVAAAAVALGEPFGGKDVVAIGVALAGIALAVRSRNAG